MVFSTTAGQSQADAERMMDNIPVQAALVNEKGQIVAVNAYWRRFAEENGYADETLGLGRNYLDTCLTAGGNFSAEARVVAEELEAVLGGVRDEFTLVYPCHSPTERRWFRLLAAGTRDPAGAVVLHFNITPEMLAEERGAASRIEAERKLAQFEHDMERSTVDEFRTLEAMSGDVPDRPTTVDDEIQMAYRAMLDASVAPTGEWGYAALRDKARAIARRLAERNADAGDVARVHAAALKAAMGAGDGGKSGWIVQESRMAFIGVLGYLANMYRKRR